MNLIIYRAAIQYLFLDEWNSLAKKDNYSLPGGE
jgi:hypothetical protein